jgi:hypothetical protein
VRRELFQYFSAFFSLFAFDVFNLGGKLVLEAVKVMFYSPSLLKVFSLI